MSHVVVRLGGGRFALPMDAVAEVGRVPDVTRVPGAPEWVAGVANWRGRILAVVDLRRLMSLDAADSGDAVRLVVFSDGEVSVGLIAERVDGVIEVDEEALEPALATLPDGALALLAGQVTDEIGPIGVVEAAAIFGLRQRVNPARRAS